LKLVREFRFINYFVVQQQQSRGDRIDSARTGRYVEGGRHGQAAVEPSQEIWQNLKSRYDRAQERQRQKRSEVVTRHEHKSELTLWSRATGYHAHLEGLPLKEIPHSYELPDKGEEPELFVVCSSIERILRKGMAILRNDEGIEKRQLSRLNAKLLNTFRGAETSQDPIKP